MKFVLIFQNQRVFYTYKVYTPLFKSEKYIFRNMDAISFYDIARRW